MRKFVKNTSGATAIEYGLIAALIALILVAGFYTLGHKAAAGSDSDSVSSAFAK